MSPVFRLRRGSDQQRVPEPLNPFLSDNRIISFILPNGKFKLIQYRTIKNINLPFKVHAIINKVGKTRVKYSISVHANFGLKLFTTNCHGREIRGRQG